MPELIAKLVDAEPELVDVLRDALADAGCLDIDVSSSVGEVLLAHADTHRPPLVIICIQDGNIDALQRLAGVPTLVVCDEPDLDRVFSTGATQCVTRPVRRRELAGRIRETMRARFAVENRAKRERKLSDTIVALQREKQDLERMVCVDALTGIANRRHAMDLLATEWKRAARDQQPFALVMIDLDCFHNYNEQYGHLGGDACLQQVADAMVRCLRRPSDFLGRYGGEEFMAVLPNTDAVGARIVAERLRASVEALALPHCASAAGHVVTITAGFSSITVLPDDPVDRLIAAADTSLLQAKTQGRNRVGGIAPLVRPSRVSAQRWERYAPVYIDPWYADRVPSFLRNVRDHVQALVETSRTFERRGVTSLQRLRDSATQLGLVAVALLIRDLEVAVREGEHALLRTAADELLQYVIHVQVVYRRKDEDTVATLAQIA